jgi:rod shape-determining protein MreD
MMLAATMAFLLLAAGLLQSVVPGMACLASAKAPVLLSLVFYYAVTHTRRALVWAAVLAGLIQDALSRIPVGYSSFCFLGLGLAVYAVRDLLFREHLITAALIGGAGAALMTLVLYGMLVVGGASVAEPWWWVGLKLGGSAVLGAMSTPAVWLAAGALDRLVGIVEVRKEQYGDR